MMKAFLNEQITFYSEVTTATCSVWLYTYIVHVAVGVGVPNNNDMYMYATLSSYLVTYYDRLCVTISYYAYYTTYKTLYTCTRNESNNIGTHAH